MRCLLLVRALFIVAAVYDGVLGLAFLFAGPPVYSHLGVTPPNHWGYLQFPAALLLIFSAIFIAVARHPQANRGLIPYGMALKVSYSGLVFYHWAVTGIPAMWKPFAVADVLFLAAFIWAYKVLPKPVPAGRA